MRITKEEFIYYLDMICDIYKSIDDFTDIIKVRYGVQVGVDSLSKICNINKLIGMLSAWCNDDEDWIDWYVYETECGSKKRVVVLGDKKYIIKTSYDLWDFLQLLNNKG